MFAIGVLLAIYYLSKQKPIEPLKKNQIIDVILILTFVGIVGARVFFVILNWSYYQNNWLEIFALWEGGLVVYGGIIAGLIGLIVFCRHQKVNFFALADLYFPALALAQAFGRVGCFLNGCCWGTISHAPWAVQFPYFKETVHPTQIYSSLFNLGLFLFLAARYKKKTFDGEVVLLYFVFYSLGRFILEYFRGDNPHLLWNMTIAQLICMALMFISALSYFLYFKWTSVERRA